MLALSGFRNTLRGPKNTAFLVKVFYSHKGPSETPFCAISEWLAVFRFNCLHSGASKTT